MLRRSNLGKVVQRRLYTFLNSWWGFSFTLFLGYLILLPVVTWLTTQSEDPCR